MNFLEELRSLDPRDPGRWPLAARAGAVGLCFLILAIVLSYVFVWDEQRPELQRREDTEQALRQEFKAKHAKAVNLEVYKTQLKDIERSFGALLRQLPGKTEVPNLLVDISQTGLSAGLEETYYYEPPTVTWSYASHAAIVEVDIKTGRLTIEKYVIVHDCGTVVNPMLVEGQVLGGTVQGLGGALLEEFDYDAEGQLLTGSFMDYAMPRAHDFPPVEVKANPVPTKTNPLGVKGAGEAGCVGALPAVVNALVDALSEFGVRHLPMPATPERLWRAMRGR